MYTCVLNCSQDPPTSMLSNVFLSASRTSEFCNLETSMRFGTFTRCSHLPLDTHLQLATYRFVVLYHILPYALLSQYKHLEGLAFEWWYNPRCVHALILDVSMLPCTWPFADRKYCILLNQTLCTVTEVKGRYYSSCLYHVALVHSSFHDRFRNMHWNLQVVKSYLHSVSK